MDISEMCDLANRNQPLPDCIQLHDSLLFLSLRHVYADFHAGKIDKDQARTEKNRLVYQHSLWKRNQDNALEAAQRYQSIVIATEGSRSELRQLIKEHADPEKIVSAACKLIEAIDGILPAWEVDHAET